MNTCHCVVLASNHMHFFLFMQFKEISNFQWPHFGGGIKYFVLRFQKAKQLYAINKLKTFIFVAQHSIFFTCFILFCLEGSIDMRISYWMVFRRQMRICKKKSGYGLKEQTRSQKIIYLFSGIVNACNAPYMPISFQLHFDCFRSLI